MKKTDYLSLDGRSIRTFLWVLEEGSVSKAAARLGVTQAAVSHTLEKLRNVLGDDLFVRAGRGIDATERARSLEGPARELLDYMKAMTYERAFDPATESMRFTVAANDLQRDIIFPSLIRHAREQEISLQLTVPPSGLPSAAMLHEGRCDLLLSPFRPEGRDIFQIALFDDEIGCCYDKTVWKRRPTLAQLQSSDFVNVRFDDGSGVGPMPPELADKEAVVSVANFSGIVSFITGTNLVSIQPRLMGSRVLKPLTVSAAPFKPQKFTMYMLWHRRHHLDPAHCWLRNEVQKIARSVTRAKS